MLDFLIVGNGLAGNVLAFYLRNQNLNYQLISNSNLSKCSQIAAGIWNPIVFKRMTKSWKVDELLPELKQFYTNAEKLLGANFYTERSILKPFFSEEEKTFWIKKAKSDLNNYIEAEIKMPDKNLKKFIIPESYGVVKHSGNIQMSVFLEACENFHKKTKSLLQETFDHKELKITENEVEYKNIKAKNIIFCEGYLVKDNPFFNWIPLNPVKGETLEISSKEIDLEKDIFNRNGFIFKLDNELFKVGATYNWSELNENISEKGLTELKNKLQQMISATYTVIKHEAGVRPSSIDRRPIIGKHPIHKNIFVFNGLGTKGVMIAPYFAKNFVNFYLNKEVLNSEINVERFYSKYKG